VAVIQRSRWQFRLKEIIKGNLGTLFIFKESATFIKSTDILASPGKSSIVGRELLKSMEMNT
jgi:hypothetical protein